MKKRFLIAIFISTLVVICGIHFFLNEKDKELAAIKENEVSNLKDLQLAKQKLREWQPFYALDLVKKHLDEIFGESKFAQEWLRISLESGTKLGDVEFLSRLYEWDKAPFLQYENAAVLVAEKMIEQERVQDFHYLKDNWQKNANLADKWILLEADFFAKFGDTHKAILLLSTKKFKHPFEVDRLLRLAFLHLNEHPKDTWEYLSEACRIDPTNPDLRLYRAHFLQAVGKESLAMEELEKTLAQHKNNILLKEEFALENIRNRNYIPALSFLQNHLCPDMDADLWVKALFLSKVIAPLKIHNDALAKKNQNNEIAHFLNLKPEMYFDENTMNSSHDEFSWMKVVHLLKQRKEESAYELAATEQKLDVYHPELRQALLRVLAYRNPSLKVKEMAPVHTTISYFKELEEPSYSKATCDFLASEEAFSALFLAAGWDEAALQLRSHIENPMYDLPVWYAKGVTEAYLQNRSLEHAISFAKQQKPSDEMALFLGELYLMAGKPKQGAAILSKMSTQNNFFGKKAAYLLANEYFKQGSLSLARKAITVNDSWLSTDGRCLLGKIALCLGDKVGAEALFSTIAHKSVEAKSYFASKAFYEKDFTLAHELTEEIYRQDPNNKIIKNNLKKIREAAKS